MIASSRAPCADTATAAAEGFGVSVGGARGGMPSGALAVDDDDDVMELFGEPGICFLVVCSGEAVVDTAAGATGPLDADTRATTERNEGGLPSRSRRLTAAA